METNINDLVQANKPHDKEAGLESRNPPMKNPIDINSDILLLKEELDKTQIDLESITALLQEKEYCHHQH